MIRTFFPTRQDYLVWIQSQPGIIPCVREPDSHHVSSSASPLDQDEAELILEGPYFVTPDYLLLRVGRMYRALQRVASQEEADFWWVATPSTERIFAAYVRNGRLCPAPIVEAMTLTLAKQALLSLIHPL